MYVTKHDNHKLDSFDHSARACAVHKRNRTVRHFLYDSLFFLSIMHWPKKKRRRKKRENVFPGSCDRLLLLLLFFFTTYYSSSSLLLLRTDALGNALFSLKKKREKVRKRESEKRKLAVLRESYHFESNSDYSQTCRQLKKWMMISQLLR